MMFTLGKCQVGQWIPDSEKKPVVEYGQETAKFKNNKRLILKGAHSLRKVFKLMDW